MLVLIFNIWMAIQSVTHLVPEGDNCRVYFGSNNIGIAQPCDKVAEEINKAFSEEWKE